MRSAGGSARVYVRAAPLALVLIAALPAAGAAQTDGATGTLRGIVRLSGTEPVVPTLIVNTTDPEVCGEEHLLESLVVSEERGVRDVIAALVDAPSRGPASRSAPGRIEVDNRDCRFGPRVAVATVGDTIVALNSDDVLHTTHYYGPLTSNVALPRSGMAVPRVVRDSGLITVLCDVHGWMKAFIRVDPHPLHAVTDGGGRFEIAGIPPGRYQLELWHEELGSRRLTVVIEPDQTTSIELEYSRGNDP